LDFSLRNLAVFMRKLAFIRGGIPAILQQNIRAVERPALRGNSSLVVPDPLTNQELL